MPNIVPISDLRNYSAVLQDVSAGSPVYLTKNGRGCYAIVDIEDQEDYEKAYEWYLEAALAGNQTGMFNVANMHYWGWHVKQDYQKAYDYFRDLYDQGAEGTCLYMGLYAENGFIGDVDYQKAAAVYKAMKDALPSNGACTLAEVVVACEILIADCLVVGHVDALMTRADYRLLGDDIKEMADRIRAEFDNKKNAN